MRRLLGLTRKGNLRLVLAEIVVREAANKWAERVVDAAGEYAKAGALLREADLLENAEVLRPEKAEVRRSEEARIRQLVTDFGGEVASLPSTSHEDVVSRAIDHRQPFDGKGRNGYRDVVLWETLLELGNVGRTVILVSRDQRAFFERGDYSNGLASELRIEAAERYGDDDAVRLFSELPAAIDSALELAEVDEEEALTIEAAENKEARGRLEELLGDREFIDRINEGVEIALTHYDLGHDFRDYGIADSDAVSGMVNAIETIDDHRFDSVYRAEDGSILASLVVVVTLTADVTLPSGDAMLLDEQPQVSISDIGWGGGVAKGQVDLAARITLDCEVDPEYGTLATLPLVSTIEPLTAKQFLAIESQG